MRTLHRKLHLQHHEHTGKLLHHRHTSYHALAIVLVIAGLFIVALGMVSRAAADDFGVAAMVAAPLPTTPPIISSPGTDATISGSSALVTGSCPVVTPQAVISISVDGKVVGTSACDTQNDFSVPASFSAGTHHLFATALNITGQTGPSSRPQSFNSKGKLAPGISIFGTQPFIYANSKDVSWDGAIGTTGQGTEFVHVDWGDDAQSNVTVQAGVQHLSHHYASLVPHNILVAASNSTGNASSKQFAETTFARYAPVALVSSTTPSPPVTSTILGLYGLYLTALAATGIFWLEAKHAARHQHAAVSAV